MERTYRIKPDVVDALRKERGLSWDALVRAVDVHPKTLRRWMKGAGAYMANIAALAKALEISPQKIIQDEAEPVDQEDDGVSITIPAHTPADQLTQLTLYLQEAADKHKADQEYPEWPGIGSYIKKKELEEEWEADPHRYDKFKQIKVYYIPAWDNARNQAKFYYVICAKSRHKEMMELLDRGEIPHFSVVVGRGYGTPNKHMKEYIKSHYGFDHDFWISVSKMDEPSRQEAIVKDHMMNDKESQFSCYADESIDAETVARICGEEMAEEYRRWLARGEKPDQ